MKKYYGKKDWSESLYLVALCPELFSSHEEYLASGLGRYVYGTDFRSFPNSNGDFIDTNDFVDQNMFITYAEVFNIYQEGKI